MTYKRLPNNLPAILRSYGLKVHEMPGWQTAGRPPSTGDFNPVGVLNHHTATTKAWTDAGVDALLRQGRSDLIGPLCQLGLRRDGTVVIVASGRCNHAGTARASGTVASGDGNRLYIGIEMYNDGRGEAYPKVQYDAAILLNAVLNLEVTGNSHNTNRAHKETSTTGKPDPLFAMEPFRKAIAAKMEELRHKKAQEMAKPVEQKEVTVASKPGPRLVHNGKTGMGNQRQHKIPLGGEVQVDKDKWYVLCTFHVPKGGRYKFTVQPRKIADTTSKVYVRLVRLNWPGLAKRDDTGHRTFQPANKIAGDWFRWDSTNHTIDGGGDVAVEICYEKSAKIRAVCKVERIY